MKTGTSTTFQFCFVEHGTSTSIDIPNVDLSFYDFDGGGTVRERLTVNGFSTYTLGETSTYYPGEYPGEGNRCVLKPEYVGPSSAVLRQTRQQAFCPCKDQAQPCTPTPNVYTNYPCTEVEVSGSGAGTTFSSTSTGYGCDNPDLPADLNEVQKARVVQFNFRDTQCITVEAEFTAGSGDTQNARFFSFAGQSLPTEDCKPPPSPPLPFEPPSPPSPPPAPPP
eukprot:scaffold64918_cov63-Phaeocystis_antarctica.AAC.1